MRNRSKSTMLPKGTKIPDHIAVVLDGNGRWARSKGMPATKGHEAGSKKLREVIEASRDWGVHTLTLWGWSTENWKRPPFEINKIFSLVKNTIKRELKNAEREGVRFIHLGRKDRLPKDVMRWIKRAEDETKNNDKYILNLALDYGGRDEIVRAVRKIIKDKVSANKINEKLFFTYLDTKDQPYPCPDLFIRTSGEQRTSGFMPWQATYAEFYFEEDHLPDMTPEKLKAAIIDFSRRRRRFGAKDRVKHFRFKPEVVAGFELKWWRLKNIPEGTKFRDYALLHIKEQYGLSKNLSKKAAKCFIEAVLQGERQKWQKSKRNLSEFYKLIKEEVKLAFEPSIAATLQVKLWREIKNNDNQNIGGEIEEASRKYHAEVFRMSHHQAAKVSHLRVLASTERRLAEKGFGDYHWDKAEDYLEKYYKALKERVA